MKNLYPNFNVLKFKLNDGIIGTYLEAVNDSLVFSNQESDILGLNDLYKNYLPNRIILKDNFNGEIIGNINFERFEITEDRGSVTVDISSERFYGYYIKKSKVNGTLLYPNGETYSNFTIKII